VGASWLGSTGFSVYKNVLDHYLAGRRVPAFKDERTVLDFFVRFWRALHDDYHFVNDQARTDDPSPFADLDAEFLLVNRYGIFQVQDILGVTRYERYCAIGSGASHAEGALEVLMQQDGTAAETATRAVQVAMKFDRATGGEIIVYEAAHQRRIPVKAKRKRTTRS